MSFARVQVNQCIRLNETWKLTLQFFDVFIAEGDPGNVPSDLTGRVPRVQVRQTPAAVTALLDLTDGLGLTFTPTSGLIEINTVTTGITAAGDYVWAIELGGTENEEPIFGDFIVEQDIVR